LTRAYMLFLARWLSWKETGEGLRRGRTRRHLGPGTPGSGPDRRYRSGRDPIRQGPQVPDAGLPD
jgi:hypothetical protein